MIMFSLLAMVVTLLVLGAALLWRAIVAWSRSRARPFATRRGLRRRGATALDRLVPSRGSLKTGQDPRAGAG